MKKIPTLFKREFENHNVVKVLPEVTEGMEWVLEGEGVATEKFDGSCCAIIKGELYKRYDAKKGKKPPEGAIPCCDPDPITGHHPHWVKCDRENPADKWFWEAYDNSIKSILFIYAFVGKNMNGTYEAVGKHFQGNPYKGSNDILIPHGRAILNVPRTFDGIRDYLEEHEIEGIVFWKDGEPKCKIKRSDFGFDWGNRK